MGHLWILIWTKVHNINQNTFTCLEFKNFTLFDQKTMFENFVETKVKIIKALAGFELMTYRFI